MRELSLTVLDIVKNSCEAGARFIEIELCVSHEKNLLAFLVRDNGRGMDADMLKSVTDPFTTSRTTRKVGMGLPLLFEATQLCGGAFEMQSSPGKGTSLSATFLLDSIDRMPLGDIAATLCTLIAGTPEIDFWFRFEFDKKHFVFDTREIKVILDGVNIDSYEVLEFLKKDLENSIFEIDGGMKI